MKHVSALVLGVLLVAGGCAARARSTAVAPLPPLSEPPEGAALAATPNYRLLPGDVLRIKFLYHPELDVKVPVREDGRIEIQGVGEVQAQGRTATELAREIEQISSEMLREPQVTVIVAEIGPHKVYVGGEVRSPGFVYFREGLTPLQAILDRGGFTDFSQVNSVLRLTLTETGTRATRLDLSEVVERGQPELTHLSVGDTLYVPRTFIGDANAFVRYYVRGILPILPRAGVGVGVDAE